MPPGELATANLQVAPLRNAELRASSPNKRRTRLGMLPSGEHAAEVSDPKRSFFCKPGGAYFCRRARSSNNNPDTPKPRGRAAWAVRQTKKERDIAHACSEVCWTCALRERALSERWLHAISSLIHVHRGLFA